MRTISLRLGNILAALAMLAAMITANSVCEAFLHQPVAPAKLKKLRKF